MLALIVDDSSSMRKILARIMERLSFEVMEAENGEHALQVLEESKRCPDVALCDWNMPVMDGLQLVQALRSSPSYQKLPVVMVTTETEMDKVVTALNAGANEYIMKPFTQEMLAEKLALIGIGTS
jgi:two-component system, chemotaxis family, chemotaxis protein CheY